MQAYELTAHIDEQGNLHLPDNCKPVFGKQARLILLLDESTASGEQANLMQAQQPSMEKVWGNTDDEVWNDPQTR